MLIARMQKFRSWAAIKCQIRHPHECLILSVFTLYVLREELCADIINLCIFLA